jgi:beta-carotene 15,15'-dioxygenase
MNILSKNSKIVLILSIIFWFMGFSKWTKPTLISIETSSLTSVICFFFILTLGISHGSLDNLKGNKLIKFFKIKSILIFYLTYICMGLFVICLWIMFPSATLLIFLIVASYHFGKEDSYFIFNNKKNWHNLFFLSKGLLIVAAPLFFHNTETIEIFKLLGTDLYFLVINFSDGSIGEYHHNLFYLAVCGNMLFFYLCLNNKKAKLEWTYIALDGLIIILLNSALSPLIAFTIYFCLIHSFRHSVSLINMLDKKNFKKGFKKFIKKAAPLTLLTALLFIFSVYILTNYYVLDEAILKVIFIGLASLTFPHILVEYLIEKNEK